MLSASESVIGKHCLNPQGDVLHGQKHAAQALQNIKVLRIIMLSIPCVTVRLCKTTSAMHLLHMCLLFGKLETHRKLAVAWQAPAEMLHQTWVHKTLAMVLDNCLCSAV